MKRVLSALILMATILCLLPSCRKCYTCSTTCYVCTLRDTATGATLDKQSVCSDSIKTYKSQRTTLQAAGYNCNLSKPNYSIDYCLNNKNGSDQYSQYYEGNGKYTCVDKK